MENKHVGALTSAGSMVGNLGVVFGKDGQSAYEIAVKNGFEGTEEEWIQSLKGVDGTVAFEDLTPEQKASLKGDKGDNGAKGADGYTPVRGIDYWTPDDVNGMVDEIVAKLPIYNGEVL